MGSGAKALIAISACCLLALVLTAIVSPGLQIGPPERIQSRGTGRHTGPGDIPPFFQVAEKLITLA